tara:strand:+ start:137 stop:715 length:579 start_codon:yes stop_codon:yes gene_type:complete
MSVLTADEFAQTEVYKVIEKNKAKNIYTNTIFENLTSLGSKAKGSKFEQITEERFRKMCSENDFSIIVEKNKGTEYDRHFLVLHKHNILFEIKGSCIWQDTNEFKWQQIRPSHGYSHMLFLAVYPDRIEFYYCEKKEIVDYVMVQDEDGNWPYAQHGGKKNINTPDTFWIQGQPSDFPFMKPLDDIFEKEFS